MSWPASALYLPSHDGDPPKHLLPAATYPPAESGAWGELARSAHTPRLHEDQGIVGHAWKVSRLAWRLLDSHSGSGGEAPGEAVAVTEGTAPTRPSGLGEAGICAEIALPVLGKGEVLAVLHFLSLDPEPLPDDVAAALEVVGARVGDVIRRHTAEKELEQSERRLRAMVTSAAHGIVIADPAGNILSWNPAAATLFGRPERPIEGTALFNLFSRRSRRQLTWAIQEVLRDASPEAASATLNLEGLAQDGQEIPLEVTLARWKAGGKVYLTAALHDLTETFLLEEALRRGNRDPLTGLPTREALLKRVRRSMARGDQRPHYRFALLLLNLDGFDEINKSLGHLVGDRLLVAVGKRLEGSVRPGDTVARTGGDEFAVLLEYVEKIQDVIMVTERILGELGRPFDAGDHEIRTSVTIGIALSDSEYDDPGTMLKEADVAMDKARRIRRPYEIADTELYRDALALVRMEADLRASLREEEFLIHYQPLVSVDTGRIVGFEALARWNHPERGIVGPSQFIPVLEASGMISELGAWVRREACAQLTHWQRTFPSSPPLMLSVNVSPVELEDPGFVDGVRQTLEATGLDPSSLHLEITETVFMKHPDRVSEVLGALRALGTQVWIDDFGTGYSSLGYLHHFPVGLLKIDRLFVGRIEETGLNKSIVRTILDLASNLGIGALAEGVETPSQLDQLRELSCRYAQGFLFSEPVEGHAAERLLAGQNGGPLQVQGWG